MKNVILLSGLSNRFTQEGFTIKPLLPLGEEFVVDKVVEMLTPKRQEYGDFIFIVKDTDNAHYNLSSFLKKRFAGCHTVTIQEHRDGPVISVLKALPELTDLCGDSGVLFTYSDLFIKSDIHLLETHVDQKYDGCLVVHKGFHPHTLYNKSFAHLRVDETRVLEVREKGCFTDNQLEEFASSGLYYFKSLDLATRYFNRYIASWPRINNEYYITMPYNLMIQDDLKIGWYEATNYISFGVPSDYKLYEYYRKIFTD